jgi:hypothetical protein
MEFTQILDSFRSLGGIADNIALQNSSFGRGLIPIKKNLPINIYAPSNLLPDFESVALDKNQQIRLNPDLNLNSRFVSFYENYQKYFGWGCGGLDAEKNHQDRMDKLPRGIKDILLVLGWTQRDFGKKSVNQHLNSYLVSRKIRIGETSKLMPIIELLNHSNHGTHFLIDQGIKITGVFKDEILVRYHNSLDPFHFLKNYRFPSPATTILSCDVEIKVSGTLSIQISRFDQLSEIKKNIKMPKVERLGNLIKISYLEISNKTHPTEPKNCLNTLLQPYSIKAEVINSLFSGLVSHNHRVLTELIKQCKLSPSEMSHQILQIAQDVIQTFNRER